MTRSTPGPWHVYNVNWGFRILSHSHAADGRYVASADQEASAYLIAAAPDLLQAAQALSGHVLEDHGHQVNYDNCAVCSVFINDLDRAIEKATGEVLTWGPRLA